MSKKNNEETCRNCQYMKCFDYLYRNYYCDHEEREDDMGRVGVGNPPKTSPEWCPKKRT